MASEIYINDVRVGIGNLRVEVEQIDVTMASKTEPDQRWEYTDPLGHYHAFTEKFELPTLTARTEHVDCADPDCACGMEGYEITVYDCRICGAPVEPGTITTSPIGREYMPGRMTWSVEVEGEYPTGDLVSVRVVGQRGVYFGVAQVTPVMSWSSDRPVVTTLAGIGELGERGRVKIDA